MARQPRHGDGSNAGGEDGVWERIWRATLATLDQQGWLDWSMAFLDAHFPHGQLVDV
jgi:hypothetical protein